MRIYQLKCFQGLSLTVHNYFLRNKKEAKKTRTRLIKEMGYSLIEILEHEVPRNKVGLINLLNSVTD